jgi:hypothetical protein
MRLPALYRGRCMVDRALPSVSCVAYWNEQRALGFCRGPFVFRGSQEPGKGRIETLFILHAQPSAKQKEAVDRGGAPRRLRRYALDNVLKFELEALVAPSASVN